MSLTQRRSVAECRRCRTFCDKVIEPRTCIEQRCSYLYSYEDRLTGTRFMGCMQKVFRAEIDVDMFELAENSGGYGGVKISKPPMPHCDFSVEPAYGGTGAAFSCVNPRFFDCEDDGPDAIRAFDLRNVLE